MYQKYFRIAAAAVGLACALPCSAIVPVVKTVPWVPSDASIPHDTYGAKSITLKGTTNVAGNFTATWSFGDGSPNMIWGAETYANIPFVIETTHRGERA